MIFEGNGARLSQGLARLLRARSDRGPLEASSVHGHTGCMESALHSRYPELLTLEFCPR